MRRRDALLIFAFWTVLGFIESGKDYATALLRHESASLGLSLVNDMPWWYTWALFTPLVVFLGRRFRLDGPGRLGAILVHLAAAGVLSLAHIGIAGSSYYWSFGHTQHRTLWAQLRHLFDFFLMIDLITYFCIVGGSWAIEFYRRYREGELRAAHLRLRAAQLEASMAEARLQALRMELNPHFLFNTLNAVTTLVRRHDHEAAVHVIGQLGKLLRATLGRGAQQEVPLERELELLGHYLDIERTRFQDRLTVEVAAGPAARPALVPTLLLQPLVENAIRHGIAPVTGPGQVSVRARREGDELVLEVEDTGRGFAEVGGGREGIGLSNTRARLEQLYGGAGRLCLANRAGGGARVEVRLPFHTERVAEGLIVEGVEAA